MTVPMDQWATFAAPTGWVWTQQPESRNGYPYTNGILALTTESRTLENMRAPMEALFVWQEEHDVALWIDGVRGVEAHNVPRRFLVELGTPARSGDIRDTPRECSYSDCSGLVGALDLVCPTCELPNECANCRSVFGISNRRGMLPREVTRPEDDGRFLGCANCYQSCRELSENSRTTRCGRPVPMGLHRCAVHANIEHCSTCSAVVEVQYNGMRRHNQSVVCNACYTTTCWRCAASPVIPARASRPMVQHPHCQPCLDKVTEGMRERDDVVEMTAEDLLIPALPNRPIRVTSIEQEFSAVGETGGGDLASRLYRAGLSSWDYLMDYHTNTRNQSMPVHVERDSSVDGGEVIYDRMRLDLPEEAEYLSTALSVVLESQRANRLQFDVRCGLHIHVDLHGYNIADTRNLVTVFSYLEDPIYRLSAANYNQHRLNVQESPYARPVRKGVWNTNREFGMEFLRRSDHLDALNLMHYYHAIRNGCTCGAVEFDGQVSACECALPKCTAEWRVFNGTSNPRKLHAYLVLAQSLTAWCQDREINAEDFPELGFNQNLDFSELTETPTPGSTLGDHMSAWMPRLEWMFRNLPTTPGERESILYCIRNSELKWLGEDRIAELAAIEPIAEEREITAPVTVARIGGNGHGDTLSNPIRSGPAPEEDYCHYCDHDWDECRCEHPPETDDPF